MRGTVASKRGNFIPLSSSLLPRANIVFHAGERTGPPSKGSLRCALGAMDSFRLRR